MNIHNYLNKLKLGIDLSEEESANLQEEIISGNVSTELILQIFNLFEIKAITENELSGIVKATRNHMIPLTLDFDVLDTCGTGGDGLNTFNISTISAIICAAAGIPVAKHGNRAASSVSGSADLLEALGVKINLNQEQGSQCLERSGIVFLFAPLFHPALKHVKEARTLYGKKTYFNIIGPMLNPASAGYQVIGISDKSKANIIGNSLITNGSKRVSIIYAKNGMDEISIEGETEVTEFHQEKSPNKYNIHPNQFQLQEHSIEKLQSKSIHENVEICLSILENRALESHLNAVLLNAGMGMYTFGKVKSIEEGIQYSREIITSGKALQKLKQCIEVSNSL